MDSSTAVLSGGCSCGDVKYAIHGEPIELVHCTCENCREASGAESVTLLLIERADFSWIRGENRVVKTQRKNKARGVEEQESRDASEFTARCRRCGSDLPRVHPHLPVVLVPAASLDGDARAIASKPEAPSLQA